MRYIYILSLLYVQVCFTQTVVSGVVLDAETKIPLEFVDVFNDKNYTSTNSEGKFEFTTRGDSVYFNRLGYKLKRFSVSAFKKDSVFLTISAESLIEVKLEDKGIYQKMIDRLEDNYPITPYKERFFLRAIVKKDGKITKLEDINGKIERKRLLGDLKVEKRSKRNYKVEIENLRKAEIREDDIQFILPSFQDIMNFSSLIFTISDSASVKIEKFDNALFKLNVTSASKNANGYLIINATNYAFEESYMEMKMPDAEFSKDGGTESRTTSIIFHSFYALQPNGRYTISKSNVEMTLECKYKGELYVYVSTCKYYAADPFAEFNVRKNVSVKKDIFRINKKYKDEFWDTQNQLLLTEEMKAFLQKVTSGDSEFKIKSNF